MNKRYDMEANPKVFHAICRKYRTSDAEPRSLAGADWPTLEAELRLMIIFA